MKQTRNTVQRELILNAVKSLRNHSTAKEIYQHIAKDFPNISKATVYRNLNLMAAANEITRVEIPNAADCFDFTVKGHYHARCRACGRVTDVEILEYIDLTEKIKDAHGLVVEGYALLFYGLCPECQKQGGKLDKENG